MGSGTGNYMFKTIPNYEQEKQLQLLGKQNGKKAGTGHDFLVS
jgi:hypothetical protein